MWQGHVGIEYLYSEHQFVLICFSKMMQQSLDKIDWSFLVQVKSLLSKSSESSNAYSVAYLWMFLYNTMYKTKFFTLDQPCSFLCHCNFMCMYGWLVCWNRDRFCLNQTYVLFFYVETTCRLKPRQIYTDLFNREYFIIPIRTKLSW